ncbi:hypothetical protein AMJ87_00030 [candidate division WOR_3 bacterium SM23_60]|uniref:Uncharacterized protein n=1 Tax=candidate division WOR_3 bacterium SM23_60 TaxID=1703780 RepID=A0A0S8GN49_UNCW3|nr:MAG: hypothetical protein AMJ87_00030 [candidate division WOR_3 bacterium SM23_60]
MFNTVTKKMPCTEKFLKWILPRGLLMILVFAISLVILGNAPRIETGIVEYKLVTGKNDQTLYVLLINMGGKNIAVAEKMGDILRSGYEETSINRALEREMHKHYDDIQYMVSLKLSSSKTIKSFVVPRDVYNAAVTNSAVKFEIEKPYSNKVTRIVTDDYNGLAVGTDYLPVNERGQFMHQ